MLKQSKTHRLNRDVNVLMMLEVFSDEPSRQRVENTLQILYSIELIIQDMDLINTGQNYLSYLYIKNYQEMKSSNCIPANSKFFDEMLDLFI